MVTHPRMPHNPRFPRDTQTPPTGTFRTSETRPPRSINPPEDKGQPPHRKTGQRGIMATHKRERIYTRRPTHTTT